MLAINEGDTDVRHVLRNEFGEAMVLVRGDLAKISADVATVESHVQTGNLAQVTEFAQIKARQMDHEGDITDLKKGYREYGDRLQNLEAGALVGKEMTTLKRWAIGAAILPSISILITAIGIYLATQ